MYFSMMPKVLLNLEGDSTSFRLVTDITTRISSSSEIRANTFLYDYYDVRDGETPEIIADKVYNDPFLHWVVLLCNDIIDPVYDWVMSYDLLLTYAANKYGEAHLYDTHHYEAEGGHWVAFDYPNAARITNIEYEVAENEKKRKIRLLQPRYISAFIAEVDAKVKRQVL